MASRLAWVIAALLLLAVAYVSAEAASQRAEYAIVVVLDQFVPYYLEVYDLPNLRELIKNGVLFEGAWVGHMASSTIVSHPVIHTGRFPKAFCMVDYGWRDPKNSSRVINPGDLRFILAGGVREIMEGSGVKSVSYYIKQRWPDAKTAGGSSKAHVAPGFEPHMDIAFLALPVKINGTDYYVPGYKVPSYLNDSRFWLPKSELYNKADEWVMDISIEILRRERPRFMVINLPLIDVWGHRTGGQAALEEMEPWVKNADRQLGRLIDELKALG
ncbi:MAG: alkaline phosphatase family protein, partial [Pyrobaculum sp.]